MCLLVSLISDNMTAIGSNKLVSSQIDDVAKRKDMSLVYLFIVRPVLGMFVSFDWYTILLAPFILEF